MSGLRMSAIWNPSQEAARGQKPSLPFGDGMAGTNHEWSLLKMFMCIRTAAFAVFHQ